MSDYNYVYLLEGKIYINLTNKCTNSCVFCIRNIKDDVAGADLFLAGGSVSAEDVISMLESPKFKDYLKDEIVFCGYGEPMLKLDVIKEVSAYIKKNYPNVKIRVNTNGQANLVYKRNVLPELKGLVDRFSVSLNGESEEVYNKISKPNLENAYNGVKEFIKEAVKENFDTAASVVTHYKGYDIDIKKCKEITEKLGAKFRERPWIEKGY